MKKSNIFLLIALLLVTAFGIFLFCEKYDGLTITIIYAITWFTTCVLCLIGIYYNVKEEKDDSCGEELSIISRSNVIQFDEMGYPLRLCIVRTNKEPYSDQIWIDTTQKPNDIVLEWEKANDRNNKN